MGASTNGIFHLFTAQAYVKLSFRFLFHKLEHIPQNNLFKTKEGYAVNFLRHQSKSNTTNNETFDDKVTTIRID